jgi:hypothetical protein
LSERSFIYRHAPWHCIHSILFQSQDALSQCKLEYLKYLTYLCLRLLKSRGIILGGAWSPGFLRCREVLTILVWGLSQYYFLIDRWPVIKAPKCLVHSGEMSFSLLVHVCFAWWD